MSLTWGLSILTISHYMPKIVSMETIGPIKKPFTRAQIPIRNTKPHKTLGSKGLTIIMAIHDLTKAYRISDKILMLNNG